MNTNAEDRDINQKLHEATGKCWHDGKRTYDVESGKYTCSGCGESDIHDYGLIGLPAYDSDLIAAFDLVEWMRKEKYLEVVIDNESDAGWCVDVSRVEAVNTCGHAFDESLPRAIALAAIRALEVK